MLEFYTSRFPKAKKEHECGLCGMIIRKGEKYHRYSGKYDGYMFDDMLHLSCQNIIDAYCNENNDSEYDEWSIRDWLHDKYCHGCKAFEDDVCDVIELSCPLIRKHYEEKGGEDAGSV